MHFMNRGAEAILYKKGSAIVKKRISKGYRIEALDKKLRKERTNREVRLLVESKRNNVNVPTVIEKDLTNFKIVMEYIEGDILKDVLDKLDNTQLMNLSRKIGKSLSKLHNANIIHGDLTTSNIVIKKDEPYFIDFGLGKISAKIEDKAVDIHLLKSALISKHSKIWKKVFEEVIKNYNPFDKEKILERLKEIEKRGRYA